MNLELNEKQSEKLAVLCFDLTKGLLLGGFSLIVVRELSLAIIGTTLLAFVSFYLIKFGLFLLK